MSQLLEYPLNWERIFGKKTSRGSIFYLPSETAAVIVQYDPDFKISTLIPPALRQIQINYKGKILSRQHQTPFLILSHLKYNRNVDLYSYFAQVTPEIDQAVKHYPWCCCGSCKALEAIKYVNMYYLYGVSTQAENEIFAQPYRINNVYGDAKCCFKKNGSNSQTPKNLKQAHTKFWMDYFSDEFILEPIVHTCRSREHLYSYRHLECVADQIPCACKCCQSICICPCNCQLAEYFADSLANYVPSGQWENYTRVICGNQFVSSSRRSDAVFISSDPELLKILPAKYLKQAPQFSEQFIVGFADQKENQWEIDLIDQKFSLNTSQVSII